MFTEQQTKWLKRVEDLFMRYGVKSLTMDDVARELGISKKTLYQFVESKNDLVYKVVERHVEDHTERSECWQRESGNAIEEMLRVIHHTQDEMVRMKSNVLFDLQKYHRDAWDRMQAYQREHFVRVVRENLERGKAEGLYRTDFDTDIIARIHVAEALLLLDDGWFPRPPYSLDILFREYLLYDLHGIVSPRGLEFLKEKIS
jgi:AcrR family transcriptional regulator